MENEVYTRETLIDTLSKESVTPLRRYQELATGSSSIFDLVRYELIISLFSPVPGALGMVLRKVFFKRLLAHVGKGTVIGPYVTLRCPNRIWLGDHVAIDGNAVLDAKGEDSRISIGNSVLLGKDSIISCSSATVELGDEVSIGPYCYIRASRGPVKLGSFITIGSHSVIISGNPDHKRLDIPMMKQQGPALGIVIEDDVWIGVGVRVIDGVKIGKGSVIGAGAVVIEDVPQYAIAAGVPARVLRSRLDRS